MWIVKKIINSVFSSSSYILKRTGGAKGYLVDVGDVEELLNENLDNGWVNGVFITHSHFDHIYGLNELLARFPSMVVYTSSYGREGLYSDRLNFSRYHESPFVFRGQNVVVLKDGDRVPLGDGLEMEVLETPGHDPGCLCYKLGHYLFTGDSFIPGVPTVTKLRGGDKEANLASLKKIREYITNETVVCPGHGKMVGGKECLEKYFEFD